MFPLLCFRSSHSLQLRHNAETKSTEQTGHEHDGFNSNMTENEQKEKTTEEIIKNNDKTNVNAHESVNEAATEKTPPGKSDGDHKDDAVKFF